MTSSKLTARVLLDNERIVGSISPYLFGGFTEHMGRCIYGGLYDPGSPQADERGFRRDVAAALREMRISILRYPGGNMLSGYNWQDGVGPKDQRPRQRELAWQSLETNQFGTNEFIDYCHMMNIEPMLGVNLGTGTIADAAALVEYCNAPAGTKYADMRVAHGYREPHNVKYWCVGNEMDGPWQIGHLEADEYARKAREAAKMMRWQDPSVKLIACGSSNPHMRTYPDWDRIVLETCWEHVDYLALHDYATNYDNDTSSFLAMAAQFESYLDTITGLLRYVKTKLRSKRDVYLSWDEWNVWYKDRSGKGGWQEAPPLSEEVYNLEDALVVAQWMSVFLRRCNILRIACMAQLVNTIAPLTTSREGLLRHPTYYPFVLFANHAAGYALDPLTTAPQYETRAFGSMPLIDASASFDPEHGRGAVFLVNRSQLETVATDLVWHGAVPTQVPMIYQLAGTNPKAFNTFEQPNVIVPKQLEGTAVRNGMLTLHLPPLSFTVVPTEAYSPDRT
jgi:alpha-N-arabinofuranosidase